MNWYLQVGKDSDVVLNSKILYSRNLRNYKFGTENLKEILEIENEVKSKLPSIGYNLKFLKMKDIDELTRKSLVEKGLINEGFSNDEKNNYSMLINDDENICVLLNSREHFEIQIFSSGNELENTFKFAREVDNVFDKTFDIAKSKKYGYLTTTPMNVGTGMNAYVTVHLPGLTKTGNIRKIMKTVNDFGMDFTGLYIKDNEAMGDIYQISNKQTIGISEENIIQNIGSIVEKIIEQERKARKLLAKNNIEFEDLIYRSYGILTNARKLKLDETLNLLSDVKLGCDMGILRELTDDKIWKMYFYVKPANLQKYFKETFGGYERDIKRAELVKILVEK